MSTAHASHLLSTGNENFYHSFVPYRIERPQPPTFTFYPIPIQRPPRIYSPSPRRAYATAEILSPSFNLDPYIRAAPSTTVDITTTTTAHYDIPMSPLPSLGTHPHWDSEDSCDVYSDYAANEEHVEDAGQYSTPLTSPTPSQLKSCPDFEIPGERVDSWDELFENLWHNFSFTQHIAHAELKGEDRGKGRKGRTRKGSKRQTKRTTGG